MREYLAHLHFKYVLLSEIDPAIKWHIEYLHQLQDKLTLELLTSWKATFTYRQKQLMNQPGSVWDYLKEFPFLQIQDIGTVLVSSFHYISISYMTLSFTEI